MNRSSVSTFVAIASLCALSACGSERDSTPEPAAGEPAPVEAADAATDEPSAPVADIVFADLTSDADAGKQVYTLCMSCHALEEGVNRVGPSLFGIVGRDAGQVEGFNYTDANANSGLVWTPEQLFTYLEDPQATIPGTRMVFPGIEDPQDRADLIAYLESANTSE